MHQAVKKQPNGVHKANMTKRNKIVLTLLFVTFLGPIILALGSYTVKESHPVKTHGTLIEPLVPLNMSLFLSAETKLPLHDKDRPKKWLLVMFGGPRGAQLSWHLAKLRRMQLFLGKNKTRISLVLAQAPLNPLEAQVLANMRSYGIVHWLMPSDWIVSEPVSDYQGFLAIVDPLGNMVLRYPLKTKAQAILSDMKRLLSVSKIG